MAFLCHTAPQLCLQPLCSLPGLAAFPYFLSGLITLNFTPSLTNCPLSLISASEPIFYSLPFFFLITFFFFLILSAFCAAPSLSCHFSLSRALLSPPQLCFLQSPLHTSFSLTFLPLSSPGRVSSCFHHSEQHIERWRGKKIFGL